MYVKVTLKSLYYILQTATHPHIYQKWRCIK